MPVDGEGNRGVAQHAEIECVVRVLPDVLSAYDYLLADGLLKAGVKLVAEAGVHDSGNVWSAVEQGRQHGIRATFAGQNQILVERRLQRSRVGDAQHGSRRLDVIRDAYAGLRLFSIGEAVVNILAQPQIEEPVFGLDLIFDVEAEFLDIGMPGVDKTATAAS